MTEAEALEEARRRWPGETVFAWRWTNRCYVEHWNEHVEMRRVADHRHSGATFEEAFAEADKKGDEICSE